MARVGSLHEAHGVEAIFALLREHRLAVVTIAGNSWRARFDVIGFLASGANSSSEQAQDNKRHRQFIKDDGIERAVVILKKMIEGFRVGHGARKSIKDEAGWTSEAVAARSD